MLQKKIQGILKEFPSAFRMLVVATFVDQIGRTLVFPFFTLYITQKFNVGMTEAGVLIGIFSIADLVGSMIGGAFTDKFGRRGIVLFGLVSSALSGVLMGLVNNLIVFYGLAVLVGVLSNIAGPARQAMVADLLPEEKRAEGFGVQRVALNLAWIIGPTIGGLLAVRSYLLLFVLDAIFSLITAVIVYQYIPETKPQGAEQAERQSLGEALAGYRLVAKDGVYMAFILISMLVFVAYQQLYSTLSVYLRDVHEVSARGYGLLMSLNAAAVVLVQFWLARKIKPYPPLLMLAVGTALYMVGFTMYGFVSTYPLFLAAMLIITVGEMFHMPVTQSLAASFAPPEMRGRYLAFYSLAWAFPSVIAPGLAGIIMDNYNPNWVWYGAGLISLVAVVGFVGLHLKTYENETDGFQTTELSVN